MEIPGITVRIPGGQDGNPGSKEYSTMSARPAFRFSVIVGVGLIVGAAPASAQTFNVKLGLWEVTSTTQSTGALPIDTSKMTPEQRARVEAAMAARANAAPTTRTTRSCMTQKELEKDLFQEQENDPACKRTVVANSPTVREVKLECTGEGKMSGDMRFEAVTPEAMKGTIKMAGARQGHAMTVSSTLTAKWLGSACGAVK
jgi:hypothetical protein